MPARMQVVADNDHLRQHQASAHSLAILFHRQSKLGGGEVANWQLGSLDLSMAKLMSPRLDKKKKKKKLGQRAR